MISTYEADYEADHWFFSSSRWERNSRGNLVGHYQGKVLTVYQQSGWFYYSIKQAPRKVTFSQRAYPTEGKAQQGLYEVLTGG